VGGTKVGIHSRIGLAEEGGTFVYDGMDRCGEVGSRDDTKDDGEAELRPSSPS
jgi:hypothetical protein